MKNVQITGTESYIGTSFKNWLQEEPEKYNTDTVDMRNDSWRETDFSHYDVVFHVAGIAHVSSDPSMKDLYYKVNRDLTIETAQKAKAEGVKQFIFMSSIIVYGDNNNSDKLIDQYTVPEPSDFYGISKLQAEAGINSLESDDFKIVILRPPMIYGKGSKGNYPKLAKAAQRLHFFPNVENRRSMLHIDNLCEFIKAVIDNEDSGLFFPQNEEYVKTSEMVALIAEMHGKKIRLVKIFNGIIKLFGTRIEWINKVFGNFAYEKSMSEYRVDYRIRNFRQSIELTEK